MTTRGQFVKRKQENTESQKQKEIILRKKLGHISKMRYDLKAPGFEPLSVLFWIGTIAS